MEKIKIGTFGKTDETKFKKIASSREDYITTGVNMVINPNYKINNSVNEANIIVGVKKIIKDSDSYKEIAFTSLNEKELPLFRAGQKVLVTIVIEGNYYSKAYSLTGSPMRSLNGEYTITVRKDSDDAVSDYLFNNLKLKERVTISEPFGDFYYEPLRDAGNVVAIASNLGIMPIYSMIQALVDGSDNYNLTLLYSAKEYSDFMYMDELDAIANMSNKVNVKYFLSNDSHDGCIDGFTSYNHIKDYFVEGDTSIFIAGDEGLLKYLNKELEEFKLPNKFIRYDSFFPKCSIKRVVKYNLSIYVSGEKFDIPCYNNKTIMKSIFDSGIYIPNKCQNGSCGFCRSELLSGEVKIINDKRNASEKKYNYIHPCSCYPLSDISIIVR